MTDKQPDEYKPTLLVSILRRQEEKKPNFGKRQGMWWYKIKQRILIFTLMAGAAYTVFWLQTRKPAKPKSEPVVEVDAEEASAVLELKEALSTSDLIYLARQMDLDPNAELPVQMQWIKDRTDISNQLLAKPDDELAQKEGTLYRMETLQLLSNLNRKYKLGKDTVDAQLYELCAANLNHGDPEVSKIAAVVVMMSALHQFSNEPNQVNLKDALSKCKQITSQLNDDHEIALAIFKYAKLMKRSDVMVDDSIEFYQVVVDQYQNSSNRKAKAIAGKAFREILFGDESGDVRYSALLAAGIKDRYRQNRKSIDTEITNRIIYSLNAKQLDDAGIRQVVSLMEILLTKDKIELAEQISIDVSRFFNEGEGAKFESAKDPVAKFKQRLSKYHSDFDLNGLTRIGGQDFVANVPTLLVFWSPSDSYSKRLLSSLNSLSVAKVIQCIVVCRDLTEDELTQVETLAKEIPAFRFSHLETESANGKRFDQQFPIPKLPYLVLLDADQKLIGINPDVRDLGKKIQAILN